MTCAFDAASNSILLRFRDAITIIIRFLWVKRHTGREGGTELFGEPPSLCVQLLCLSRAVFNSGQDQAGRGVYEWAGYSLCNPVCRNAEEELRYS